MANENKYYEKPFAENGTKSETPNESTGGAVSYDSGYGPDYELPAGDPNRKRIERPEYNDILHGVTKNIKQHQENNNPTWIEDKGDGSPFAYAKSKVVSHGGQDWISLSDNNTDEPLVASPNWALWDLASAGVGANLLSNHNFQQKGDPSQPTPDATPRSYPPTFEIFQGVFTGATGVTNATLVDGKFAMTAGSYQFKVGKTGGLVNVVDFVASVADFDGKPRSGSGSGVSFSLIGDEYVITVDSTATDVGSVKFEQGLIATRHEAKNLFDIYGDPAVTGTSDIRAFGAAGDGVTDDTDAIEAWFASGENLIGAEGIYRYTGNGLAKNLFSNFSIDGRGMILDMTPSSEKYYGVILHPQTDGKNNARINISELGINGNNKFAYGIRVNSNPDVNYASIEISKCTIRDLNNANLASVSSVSGISVRATCSNTIIRDNFLINFTRTQVSPGVVNTSGISITGITSSASITNNNVRNVESPVGDADADGILAFSNNRLSDGERQQQLVVIEGNKVTQCKGRWVKLQCANSRVVNNYFESLNMPELITNFRGVDAQSGGVTLANNFMRLWITNGGTSASFLSIQSPELGADRELNYNIHDNDMQWESSVMPYGIIASFDRTQVDQRVYARIHDNSVRSESNAEQLSAFVYLGLPDQAEHIELYIRSNSIQTLAGEILKPQPATKVKWEDATTGPVIASYLHLDISDNHNSVHDSNSDIWAAATMIPYITHLKVKGNAGYDRGAISAQGVDPFNLPDGCSFYFNTDGSTGGLLNVPPGYNRYVSVERISPSMVRLTTNSGSKLAQSSDVGVWYESVLTLI